jgi:hypothetical protein
MPPDNFTIKIEKGRSGLLFATSPEIKGLLVGEPTLHKLLSHVPVAIAALETAAALGAPGGVIEPRKSVLSPPPGTREFP